MKEYTHKEIVCKNCGCKFNKRYDGKTECPRCGRDCKLDMKPCKLKEFKNEY